MAIVHELRITANRLIIDIRQLADSILFGGSCNGYYHVQSINEILDKYRNDVKRYFELDKLTEDERQLSDQLETSLVKLWEIKTRNDLDTYSQLENNFQEIDRIATDIVRVMNELFYREKSIMNELKILANRFVCDCINLSADLSDEELWHCYGHCLLCQISCKILPKYAGDIKRYRKIDYLSKEEKKLLKILVLNASKLKTLNRKVDIPTLQIRFDAIQRITKIHTDIENTLKQV
jgi:hypothetical protein